MKKERKDFIHMWEFVWMSGVVAASGVIGILVFVAMCVEGIV